MCRSLFFVPALNERFVARDTHRGADALEEILGRVKEPATAAMEKLDREIQDRVTRRVQASAKSLFQNVIFSIAPIVVLIGLDRLI